MAILNRDKPRRATLIPEGVEVSEQVTVQKSPGGQSQQIKSSGNIGVITDFIIRDLSGPSKKKFVNGAKTSQDVPIYLGGFVSGLAVDELKGAQKFNNRASPDSLAEVLKNSNNFGFNLLSSEQDNKGNPVYMTRDPQADQAKALAKGLNDLIKARFIDPSSALKWTRNAITDKSITPQQPQRMGQLQNQSMPEKVDFSVSESLMPEELPPMEGL